MKSTARLACEVAAHDCEIGTLLRLLLSLPAVRLVPFQLTITRFR